MKDLIYILQFKSSFKYKVLYIYSLFRKIIGKILTGKFKSSYINTYKNYIIENKNGKFKIFEPSDMHAILKPHNEEELLKFFNLDGGVFLDIGGNVGKYSIIVGRQNKNNKIYTFEPNPNIFNNYLLENISLNNLGNIEAINEGLSDKKGFFSLYIPKNNDFGSSSILIDKNKNTEEIKIKVNTLNDFVKEKNIKISSIKLIKIDVEGFEYNVLKGANKIFDNLQNVKLIIEISNNFEKINNFLLKKGFKPIFKKGINYVYEK